MDQHAAWLRSFSGSIPASCTTPVEIAGHELSTMLPGRTFRMEVTASEGENGEIFTESNGSIVLKGSPVGILYAAYRYIFSVLTGLETLSLSAPRYGLRMINCWDNADGSVERGYSGKSLFFRDGKLNYEPERIRLLARLMASVGLNTICINNVNVHFPAQLLLEDDLDDLAALADLFRPFGIRLMVSIDFSRPLAHGVPTADPLNPAVRAWWKERAAIVYAKVPDLAGFLVKADSENRPGPFTYGRNHADGANMLAEALKPFGGVLVWRCFVYNCRQDWRDTKTDRPMAAWEHYAFLDGQFADNVILQVKNGPVDFQVREPVSPLLLGLKKTHMALEIQLAQEYTGQQIDIYTMLPMWQEIFEQLPQDNIMSMAAVSNLGNDRVITGHPFAALNFFAYGLLTWEPSMDMDKVTRQWIRLNYKLTEAEENSLTALLLNSRSVYEKYNAPLGIGWMVTPHTHYGPNPDGYEYDLWGTYHKANRNAIGIDRTASGTGYLLQYSEDLQRLYGTPESCPDRLKLFFHRLPYDYKMSDGRTLIQRIYDDHFEGYDETQLMKEALTVLPLPEEEKVIVLERMEKQCLNAREWRDVINTFLYRLSGVEDAHGRTIYD